MSMHLSSLLSRLLEAARDCVSGGRRFAGVRTVTGESPLWLARTGHLLLLDCQPGRLVVIAPAGGAARLLTLPEPCFWIVACRQPGRFLAGFAREIVELHCDLVADPVVVRVLFSLPPEITGVRFNDAKAGPRGCLFTGTMDVRGAQPRGTLYRVAPDGTVDPFDAGYTIPNGPAVSPCGTQLYQADSPLRLIHAYPLDAEGRPGVRRSHIRLGDKDGYPDGMACDVAGGLWVAHWGGGRVTRFRPDGSVDRVFPLPARAATSVAFFGAGLARLAVTTAVHGRRFGRTGGGVYWLDPGVAGMPVAMFGPEDTSGSP